MISQEPTKRRWPHSWPLRELEPGLAAEAEVNRLCELEDYEEITVPSFDVDGEMVA